MTLTCEDDNSKLVEIVTVADAQHRFDDCWVQIWKLKVSHTVNFLFTRFGQDFQVEIQARL